MRPKGHLCRALLLAALCACARRVEAPAGDVGAPPDLAVSCRDDLDCDDRAACSADRCVAGRCVFSPVTSRCPVGTRCERGRGCVDPACGTELRNCRGSDGGDRCVDPLADPAHCGGCDRRCAPDEECTAGLCVQRFAEVGSRCASDRECAPPLTCTAELGEVCSMPCAPSGGTAAEEARACGDRSSTCLALEPGRGQCLRSCDPRAGGGGEGECPAGFACTGLWFRSATGLPDRTGCLRWCGRDEHCAGDRHGPRCDPRVGRCDTAGPAPSLLPDGMPCDPTMRRAAGTVDRSAQCRGECLRWGSDPRRGLCASFVQRRAQARCPDEGSNVMLGPEGADQLGLCWYRLCQSTCDCPNGTACVHPENGSGNPQTGLPRLCGYPTRSQPAGAISDAGCPGPDGG